MAVAIKLHKNIIFWVLIIVLLMPIFVSADTGAGIKPSSFFYFLDIASEKVSLFFTFGEKAKAEKVLSYVDERIAELKEVALEDKPLALEAALKNYNKHVESAVTHSKRVEDEEETENLLGLLYENTERHKGELNEIIPDLAEDARNVILDVIEANQELQKDLLKEIVDLRQTVEELRVETEELKEEIEALKEDKKPITLPEVDDEVLVEEGDKDIIIEELIELPNTPTKAEPLIIEFPSGMIVEIDEEGNIVRYIYVPPESSSSPTPAPQPPPSPVITPTPPSTLPPAPEPTSLRPEIIKFTSNKYDALLGDEITLSWEARDATTCAIVETKDISIAFTGHLPSGSMTILLKETTNLKSPTFTYYAICAGPDWFTDVEGLTIQVEEKPKFVADISFDKDTVANDGTDSIKVTIVTKDSNGVILPKQAVEIYTYGTEYLTSDWNGIINTTITTTGSAGMHKFTVRKNHLSDSYSKNYTVINGREGVRFNVLSSLAGKAPASNEGLILLAFDWDFSKIQNLKLDKVSFKLEGLTSDWITDIKFTKSADALYGGGSGYSPVIIPSSYTLSSDGLVSVTPSNPIEIFYKDRLIIMLDTKNNSSYNPEIEGINSRTLLEYATIIYQDSFEFSGLVNGLTGIITPELTNQGNNSSLILPNRENGLISSNYCLDNYDQVTMCP